MKYLSLLLLSTLTLFANQSIANYDVTHTLLGDIAQAHVIKEINGDSYIAELVIETTGVAALFSNNLVKQFISQGSFSNGSYYPDVLTVIQRKDKQQKFLTYRFDHKNKILHVDKCSSEKLVKSTFNMNSLEFDDFEYIEFKHNSHRTKSYVSDDVISLFLNVKKYINKDTPAKQVSLMVAGIYDYDEEEENIDGLLPFIISQKDMHNIIETSISKSTLCVALSEKVFHDDDKWLYIDINKDSLPQSVTLNDIAFGNVYIERILKKTEEKIH